MSQYISQALQDAHQTLSAFIENTENVKSMETGINKLIESFKAGGKVISCGNGGSMCDAMHFAEELSGKFRKERPALPALSISDPGHITCVANDYGYDQIFSRYIEAHGKKDDVLLAISTSGNSPNIIAAVEAARKKGMYVVLLSGKDGGKLKSAADVSLIVPAACSDRIQEVHIKIIHTFIEGVERSLFPQNYV
jgi:D-sedoheptulose 7-phosphate isomerase